jgi:hypothetical protein
LNGNAFEEDAVLDPDPEDTKTQFGWFVAVDGDTIVIGASDSEAAIVFVKNGGGQWELQQRLTPSDTGSSF